MAWFHKKVGLRQQVNHIARLKGPDDKWYLDTLDLKRIVTNYFRLLFSTKSPTNVSTRNPNDIKIILEKIQLRLIMILVIIFVNPMLLVRSYMHSSICIMARLLGSTV